MPIARCDSTHSASVLRLSMLQRRLAQVEALEQRSICSRYSGGSVRVRPNLRSHATRFSISAWASCACARRSGSAAGRASRRSRPGVAGGHRLQRRAGARLGLQVLARLEVAHLAPRDSASANSLAARVITLTVCGAPPAAGRLALDRLAGGLAVLPPSARAARSRRTSPARRCAPPRRPRAACPAPWSGRRSARAGAGPSCPRPRPPGLRRGDGLGCMSSALVNSEHLRGTTSGSSAAFSFCARRRRSASVHLRRPGLRLLGFDLGASRPACGSARTSRRPCASRCSASAPSIARCWPSACRAGCASLSCSTAWSVACWPTA
jgi:hypothetical protein